MECLISISNTDRIPTQTLLFHLENMFEITSALLTACILGLMFRTTRWVGITAAAMLTFIYPFPAIAILILSVAVYFYLN